MVGPKRKPVMPFTIALIWCPKIPLAPAPNERFRLMAWGGMMILDKGYALALNTSGPFSLDGLRCLYRLKPYRRY